MESTPTITLEELTPAASGCARSPLAPTEQEVALLTTQYRKAVNGLYEAYRFGQMLAQVKARLEQFSRDAACGTAREVTVGANGNAITPGWNAGTGLKAWLSEHCPEINYSTARRFLAIAEKTNAALAAAPALVDSRQGAASRDGEADGTQGRDFNGSDGLSTSSASTVGDDIAPRYARTCQLSTVDCEPSEQAVRDFLEGKSQRQVLKAPSKPTVRHAMSEAERAEKLAEVCKGFLESLEGVERTGESDLLRLEDRREIVTRLKALARRLEEAARV